MRLFGTDGVRGEAGRFLNANDCLKLAMAAGIYFRQFSNTNKILLGKDTRKSGYMIESSIVAGLTAVGYDVLQIGPMPTPAVAFLTENMRCDAGIMISASHNPYYDNGLKFFDSRGDKIDSKTELDIENIYFDEELLQSSMKNMLEIGTNKRIDDVIGRYIVQMKNSFPKELNLKNKRVVLDVANGAAYKVAPTIFNELGADVIVINNNPNGSNINDACGALYANNLANEVKKMRADIGFAFDGDADRLVVVDENGRIIHGDVLTGALAEYLQESDLLKNKSIVSTKMSNLALKDYLKSKDINLITCDVGDKNIIKTLNENNLNFGAEPSGHIIFSDFSKTGDGIVASLQVMAIMLKKSKKASEIFNIFSPYPQKISNLRISQKYDLDNIEGLMDIKQELKKEGIYYLFRYSGTENLLRLLLQGKNQHLIDKKMLEIEKFFLKALA